ncbi:Chemotaxis regulator - transmits chemoreceptor signals to flagelllar motor components CheY [Salinispira pacifica]|uniref:histidine kinase n=2 Tax=Salinispira pacifica TaxID=1307761 RepID=V5WGQ2_9SPIO|nr:Chemotaxis regulator - transmits chemoreceptor signals to flagelllar motor components CheY [Salinispira pacifica]
MTQIMRKFIQRALNKLSKLDKQQIHALIYDLARENEHMEVVLDSLTDGVLVSDKDNRLILSNKAAERMIPFREYDMYEKIIWDVVADRDIAEFIQTTIEREESIRDREFTLDNLGNTRILALSIMPLVRRGRVRGNVVHIEDISEKRWSEARLRRAESLASLTTLAAGVAHEIKNPLGSIGIHIQLMQRTLDANESVKSDDVRSYLDIVNEEVERLNRIVMDFLFAVRPMDIHLEDHDLNALLHEIMDFMKYEVEESGIQLKEDYQVDIPHILLDEKFIKQAILNIVKNAINAMSDGGNLTLSTRCRGDEVILRIIDTGVGMSEEVMEKIFEPYFTTKDFGSGIGLTIVYKIMKEHRGDISVISQEGRGTTFTLSFPVPPGQQNLIGETPGEAGNIENSGNRDSSGEDQ